MRPHQAREVLWRGFAEAQALTLSTHGHGLLWCASGAVKGLDLWVSEQIEGEGVEFGAVRLLDPSLGFVLLDAAYRRWFGEARARRADAAAATLAKIRSRRKEPLASPNPFADAYLRPHRHATVPPTTGIQAFDDRFETLAGDVAGLSSVELLALTQLPQCSKMMASGGKLWVHTPLVGIEGPSFDTFLTVCRSFRPRT